MEREVQYAQKLESLGVMASGIAHDFNNLLMAIQGNADLILNNQTDENTKQSAGEIINASERASEICRQMLAYSGDESLYAESIDINEKIRQISKMLEMSVSKKAEVRYDFDQSLPPLAADIMQLRQIILNLVLNASEAIESENGEIVVSTGKRYCQSEDLRTIYIQDKLPSGEYVSIQVSDTGVGMDRDNLKRIFDPFYTSKFPGRGLGMPTVLGLIRGHRGSIDIESTPGEGTAVTVFLPAFHAPEEEEAKLEPGKTEENDSEDSSGRQVLMVDDERGILIVAEKMLTNLGYKVITASNGNEALQQFENNPETDCAILDLTMPQMGGKTAAAKLREIDPNLPILISSGYSEKDLHNKFAGMNINGYIQKPYNRKQLNCTLKQIFRDPEKSD